MNIGTKLAVPVLLFAAAATACAQDPSAGRFGHAAGCVRENSSRLPSELDCGEIPRDPIKITTEVGQLPITVTLPEVVITDCEAIISLEYTQRGAIARVKGEIVNEMCPASAGGFIVSIRTADESGEVSTHDYPETWQRSDDQPVTFSKDYPIGDNVDLLRAWTRKSTCRCAAE